MTFSWWNFYQVSFFRILADCVNIRDYFIKSNFFKKPGSSLVQTNRQNIRLSHGTERYDCVHGYNRGYKTCGKKRVQQGFQIYFFHISRRLSRLIISVKTATNGVIKSTKSMTCFLMTTQCREEATHTRSKELSGNVFLTPPKALISVHFHFNVTKISSRLYVIFTNWVGWVAILSAVPQWSILRRSLMSC